MGEDRTGGLFRAAFTYTDAVLSDFEAMYRQKKEISPAMRIVLGVLGAAGAVYFGYMLYRDGISFARVGYVLICSVLLVLALSNGGKRRDDSTAKYRKYYQDKQATFDIDESGVEMHLDAVYGDVPRGAGVVCDAAALDDAGYFKKFVQPDGARRDALHRLAGLYNLSAHNDASNSV